MPSDCYKKPNKYTATPRLSPLPEEIDAVRVWKLTFWFKDGSVRVFDGEEAFWGTGKNASDTAAYVADIFADQGKAVKNWETEQDENG